MRIAQVAPLFVRIPPERYGGTERAVHALTETLVARGHDVTLFAAGGTQTSAELHASSPAPLWEIGIADPLAYRVLQVEELANRSGDFDVIHSHIDYLPWLARTRLRAPLVTTTHGHLYLAELRPLMTPPSAVRSPTYHSTGSRPSTTDSISIRRTRSARARADTSRTSAESLRRRTRCRPSASRSRPASR